jgi:hypothetical protein
MREILEGLVVAVAALGITLAPVHAREVQAPDNSAAANAAESGTEIRPSEIKAPWDFAPPEQVIVGRDPTSFRKEGTLLAKTSGEFPAVDEKELLERKYAMYSDQRFYLRLRRAGETGGSDAATLGKKLSAGATQSAEETPFHWVPWTLAALIAAVVLVAWRKRWFVPFSVRTAERRALRAASARARSHAAKGPPRKVRPR